jgi:hypothetical protein
VAKLLDKIDDGEDIYENEDLNDHDIEKCNDYEDWALTHNMNEYKNYFFLIKTQICVCFIPFFVVYDVLCRTL